MSSGTESDKRSVSPIVPDDGRDKGHDDSNIYSFIGLSGQRLSFTVSLMCGVGFLLFGYDQGVMGSLLTLPSFRDTFPDMNATDHPDRSTYQGFVIAIYEIGCMCSALSTIYLGDKLGRTKMVFMGCTIMMVGGALQACAYTSPHLIVARIVTGLGNGFITSTVPVWQSEIAKAHQRGRLICFQCGLIAGGIALSYWVDFAFYFLDRPGESYVDVSFRFPIAFQCLFPVLIMPFVLRLPESPRWLLRQGREYEARKVFSALDRLPANHEFVTEEVQDIVNVIEMEKRTGAEQFSLNKLLQQGPKRHFHRLCLSGWAQLMQQICGINLITYYAGTIFEDQLGLSPLNSRILAACNGTEYFLASLIPVYFIEKWGRRPLLIVGSIGQTITMVCLTILQYYGDPKTNPSGTPQSGPSIGAAVFLFVFNTFFALAFLSEMWLLPPELSSLEIRAPSAAISTACNWISNFLIVMITPPAFANIHCFTYTIFAAINFLIVPVLFFLYPETKNRSLEEMDIIFSKTPLSQPWKVVSIAKHEPYMHAGLHEGEAAIEFSDSHSNKDKTEVVHND